MNKTVKLAELADIRQGYSVRKAVKPLPRGTHCILQLRDFNDDRTGIDTAHMVRLSPGNITEDNELRAGDVLFLAKGSRNFALALPELPPHTLAANYFFTIRPLRNALPAYIAWFLNRPETQEHLARFSGGGVHMPVIRKGVLAALEIPVPSLSVQETITALDALVQHEEDLCRKLNSTRKTLYDAISIRMARQPAEKETQQ